LKSKISHNRRRINITSIDQKNLQQLADREKKFFVHVTTELVDIKAMLSVLLDLKKAELMVSGLSHDEAHQMIQDKLAEHQKRLLSDAHGELMPVTFDMDEIS
jgi:hypothetical protein